MKTQQSRAKRPLTCSFCGQDEHTVSKLLGGPGVHICGHCVSLCNAILEGDGTPPFARVDALDDAQLLASLLPASSAARSLQDLLRQRVSLLRARGVSWERIGEALGITRQAAWERFAP